MIPSRIDGHTNPAYGRAWREGHREQTRTYQRNYMRARRRAKGIEPRGGPWTERSVLEAVLLSCGSTLEQYDVVLEKQNGGCGICGRKPPFGRFSRLCVDHDHATGKFRGLLCLHCNSFLGRIRDNPEKVV